MAVKIRLTRTGGKNNACFRVVAADTRAPRDGRFIEILGWYDPNRDGCNYELKLDRIEEWVGNGALLSDTVASMVREARRNPAKLEAPVEEPVEEATPPAEETASVTEEETPEAPEEPAEQAVEADAAPEEEVEKAAEPTA